MFKRKEFVKVAPGVFRDPAITAIKGGLSPIILKLPQLPARHEMGRVKRLTREEKCTYNYMKFCGASYEKRENTCHKNGVCPRDYVEEWGLQYAKDVGKST